MDKTPLVTGIMPTRGRERYAWRAIAAFLSQTYEPKELVIVDDEQDPSLSPDYKFPASVRYFSVPGRNTIGWKRNVACEHANGDVVMHFDDDDWSAPDRMTDQVTRLLEAETAAVTGYHSMIFYEEHTRRWAKYNGSPDYALGTSLCYYRGWWRLNRFDERRVDTAGLVVHEDNLFIERARNYKILTATDARGLMIARSHPNNTSAKTFEKYGQFDGAAAPREFMHTL